MPYRSQISKTSQIRRATGRADLALYMTGVPQLSLLFQDDYRCHVLATNIKISTRDFGFAIVWAHNWAA